MWIDKKKSGASCSREQQVGPDDGGGRPVAEGDKGSPRRGPSLGATGRDWSFP